MNLNCLTPRTRLHGAIFAAFFLAALPSPVAAQQTGDAAEGRRLAGTYCVSCHIITPTAQVAGNNGVPTFAEIARRPSTTPTSLRAFLLRPHPKISDMQATSDELRDLIAFILSLRGQ
jgi:mono/diheme cytochrome c family protein